MTWFAKLFGFEENSLDVKRHISIEGQRMLSSANGRVLMCGQLTVPTLEELRQGAYNVTAEVPGRLQMREIIADAQSLHADPANAGSLFQVASQFNLLEMAAPEITPADGVTIYKDDRTQGPACAIACAAGTVQRNWFAQSTQQQIDTLALVGEDLGNGLDADGFGRFWEMRNGYALLTGEVPDELPEAHDELQIGIQSNTQVTLAGTGHLVTQAYCSALPLGYSSASIEEVEPLVRMVLNSTYEATLAAGVINASQTGNNTVWLTLVGGGVFHNPVEWIIDAIDRACQMYEHCGLDVAVVSYRSKNPLLAPLLQRRAQ